MGVGIIVGALGAVVSGAGLQGVWGMINTIQLMLLFPLLVDFGG
jgi:hypothetical protein